MDLSKVTISCTKSDCPGQASLHQFGCDLCETPVTKRYLRVLQKPGTQLPPNQLLGGRYFVLEGHNNIVLDTMPDKRPVVVDDFSAEIESYLKLSTHLLHCPKVFGLTKHQGKWLLEYPSVSLTPSGVPVHQNLFESLTEAWPQAEPLQQINWLSQIARMIYSFSQQGVAGTFYQLPLLAVNGGVIQITELYFDDQPAFDFVRLAEAWRDLLARADKSIQKFCKSLYVDLSQGKINDSRQLRKILASGISELGRSQYQYKYSIYTQTDAGPSREHNEDACYPAAGRVHHNFPLTVVCDGIGGHEKGEVASAIAIDTIQRDLSKLTQGKSREIDTKFLQETIYQANDAIVEQNDLEQRHERERMGTTVVLGLMQAPYTYLCHVGDSRIYRITEESCHQLTYDDDLGSREVRLGYALYQDALSYPAAGALVQALGMNPSQALYPTTQRIVTDRDMVYLLCSDGLSDFGRVDEYWQSEIAPLLTGQTDLKHVGEKLIAIANSINGHDNATIALLHVHVKRRKAKSISYPGVSELDILDDGNEIGLDELITPEDIEEDPPVTQPSFAPQRKKGNWLLFLIGLLGIGGIGFLGYGMWQRSQQTDIDIQPEPSPTTIEPKPIPDEPLAPPTITIPDTEASSEESEPSPVTKNSIIRLKPESPINAFYTPQAITTPDAISLWIPGGSIVQIKQINGEDQLLLEVCQLGTQRPLESGTKILAKGNRGWTPVESIVANKEAESEFVITEEIENLCIPPESESP